jgi:hypothetical protein
MAALRLGVVGKPGLRRQGTILARTDRAENEG